MRIAARDASKEFAAQERLARRGIFEFLAVWGAEPALPGLVRHAV